MTVSRVYKRSAYLTDGQRKTLVQLILITIGINLVEFIAVIIGTLVTIPLTILITARAYLTLKEGHPGIDLDVDRVTG